jgi:hypothetical protein
MKDIVNWCELIKAAYSCSISVEERAYAASTQGVDDIMTLFVLTHNAQQASKFFKILTNFAKAALFLKYLLCVRMLSLSFSHS